MTREGREQVPDPLIDAVRQWRRDLLASHEDDLGMLLETIERRQKERPEGVDDLRGPGAGDVPCRASMEIDREGNHAPRR